MLIFGVSPLNGAIAIINFVGACFRYLFAKNTQKTYPSCAEGETFHFKK